MRNRVVLAPFLIAVAVAVAGSGPLSEAGSARAQGLSPDYGLMMSGAQTSSYLANSYLLQSLVNDLSSEQSAGERLEAARSARADARLQVDTAPASRMTATLAAHYPSGQRAPAQAVFEDLLSRYHLVERQFGIPQGDVGGALAAFVAGNWMALRDRPFPDASFPPLVDQMRGLLSAQAGFAEAPKDDLRDMYDQLVILGMLMAATQMGQAASPDPALTARMHDAAADYLRQMFNTDPERLRLGPDGIDFGGPG